MCDDAPTSMADEEQIDAKDRDAKADAKGAPLRAPDSGPEIQIDTGSSLDVTDDVVVDWDDEPSSSNLLSITSENLTLDTQIESLKAEAERTSGPLPLRPPPPLPAAGQPASAPPGPVPAPASRKPPPVPSGRPPPLPAKAAESVRVKVPSRATAFETPHTKDGIGSVRPAPPPPLPLEALPTAPLVRDAEPAELPKKPSGRPPPLPEEAIPTAPIQGEARSRRPEPKKKPAVVVDAARLVDQIAQRLPALEAEEDRVGVARAHVELSILHEILDEDVKATLHAEQALRAEPSTMAAHAILRRRIHGRGALALMLEHLDAELRGGSGDAIAPELLAERARLAEIEGVDDKAALGAWREAVARAPNHAAALKGLEAELTTRANVGAEADALEELAEHYARLADAWASQPELAAWLHVERALILEWRLGRLAYARGALERALELAPGIGAVRDAVTLHVAAHGDPSALAELLAEEATLEPDRQRSARLFLDAAVICDTSLDDAPRAIELLERAAGLAPTTPWVDRRVLDDLVRLYERLGTWPEVARARRARLGFFADPAGLVLELRRLATLEERLGNVDAAAADLARAREIAPDDRGLFEASDRLLAGAGRTGERIAAWLGEAARAAEGPARAKSLLRAAELAEEIGRADEALRHLRAAWAAAPGEADILDPLARLTSPAPSAPVDGPVRQLAELHAQAAQTTKDPGRKVAYLEKAALLWEELLGDAGRAARLYQDVLDVEPDRRGAVLGLARTAARVRDDAGLARALLAEAKLAGDGPEALALRARAAAALGRVDPTRAAALVDDVLAKDPAHASARELETRLHQDAGRWERVVESLRARLEHEKAKDVALALHFELAEVQATRLRRVDDAVATLLAAQSVSPNPGVIAEEIVRLLEPSGDARTQRDAHLALARGARTDDERALHLLRAAEIEEMVLRDDEACRATYQRALEAAHDDELVADRLDRVLARRGHLDSTYDAINTKTSLALDELVAHVGRRREKTRPGPAQVRLGVRLASLLVMMGRDTPLATQILEAVRADSPREPAALRLLETLARKQTSWTKLAEVLSAEADALTDVRARLGALWNLAAIEEWRTAGADPSATYARILELDPTDAGALESMVRLHLSEARRRQPGARKIAVDALRALAALATDEGVLVATETRLALLLELHAAEVDPDDARRYEEEALERWRTVLAADPSRLAAAVALGRLAAKLDEPYAAFEAAEALADLSPDPRAKADRLLDAAELLASDAEDLRFGTRDVRHERAAVLLEKALESDPDLLGAAARLSEVRGAQGAKERLVDVFRRALFRAAGADAVVFLGGELAKVARAELGDVALSIEAMRRVREVAPGHVPSLLTLAELFIAQRAWPEALEVLEDIVARGSDKGPRLTALFALASIHEKVFRRPEDAEVALRTALSIDERNPKALRALVHRLAAKQDETEVDDLPRRQVLRGEICSLLERLADVEPEPRAKTEILLELADLLVQGKRLDHAERVLVEAVAHSPGDDRAFGKLGRLFKRQDGEDAVSYARALTSVLGRGKTLGHEEARWHATLGRVQVVALGRLRDGAVHLARAIELEPTLSAPRLELASAQLRMGAADEAVRTLTAMIQPSADPLLALDRPADALELFERALAADRRPEEAVVVSELRAIVGDLDEGRYEWLRGRRISGFDASHAPLERSTLVAHMVPPESRHVLLDVAGAISGFEARALRAEIGELGITTKDRIGKRSGHPMRAQLDRLARALSLGDVDLVVTPRVTRTRVLAQDVPWVVVPQALAEQPEATQLAGLGRALARIALGVPWLEELPPPHIEALLLAAARVAYPGYGHDALDALGTKLVAQYEQGLRQELSRKQKQALDRLAPQLSAAGPPPSIETLIGGLARAELRIAYALAGDLLATLDELRSLDPAFQTATETPGPAALRAVLEHAFAGDVVRFGLTPEATALRRRVGSTWAG